MQRNSGPIAVEYTWTLPPEQSGMPILLFFNQPEENGFAGELTAGIEGAGEYVVVEGDTVILRLELTEAGWRGSINGEALPASATDRLSGGQLSQPAFYSQRHGLHTATTEVFGDDAYISGTLGEKTKTISYFQKGLAFTEPLPEPDPDNPDEPLPIENTVVWSDGSELLDEDVSWSVRVPDDVIGGDGTEISVFWDPLRQTFNEILNRAPTDEELEEIEVTKFEELDMSIEARTRVYEEKEADGYPSLQYVLRKNFGALGANEFHIINSKVLPEEPFTEEEPFAELEADIVLVGPDPANYDVTWFVDIKNPEGEVVLSEFQSGQGYQVYAFWDGIVDGQLVEEPETYQFHIRVDACESDGGGGAFRAIRSQETTTPECLGEVAKADEPITFVVNISEIQFGDGATLSSSFHNGPYKVFDYINGTVPDGPQWESGSGEMSPVVMRGGAEVFVGAEFEVKGSTSSDDSIIVRATGQLNGQEIVLGTSAPIPKEEWDEPVIFSFELPAVIDRYGLTIDWEFRIEKNVREVRTPSNGRKHRIYSVAQGGSSKIVGSGAIVPRYTSNTTEGQAIWYNPNTFEEETPTSEPSFDNPPTRSPLDLATQWAQGIPVDDEVAIVVAISRNLYDKGGYFYHPTTKLVFHSEDSITDINTFRFYTSLRGELMECRDAAATTAAYSRMLGVDANLRLFQPPRRVALFGSQREQLQNTLFTNYLAMVGESAGRAYSEGVPSYIIPRSLTGDFDGYSLHDNFDDLNYLWKQWNFSFHMIAEIDSLVVDPVSRIDSLDRGLTINRDLIFNQENSPSTTEFSEKFKRKWSDRFETEIGQEVIDNFGPGYDTRFGPSALNQNAISLDDYVRNTFYLMDLSESARAFAGFNSFFDIKSLSHTRRNLRLDR